MSAISSIPPTGPAAGRMARGSGPDPAAPAGPGFGPWLGQARGELAEAQARLRQGEARQEDRQREDRQAEARQIEARSLDSRRMEARQQAARSGPAGGAAGAALALPPADAVNAAQAGANEAATRSEAADPAGPREVQGTAQAWAIKPGLPSASTARAARTADEAAIPVAPPGEADADAETASASASAPATEASPGSLPPPPAPDSRPPGTPAAAEGLQARAAAATGGAGAASGGDASASGPADRSVSSTPSASLADPATPATPQAAQGTDLLPPPLGDPARSTPPHAPADAAHPDALPQLADRSGPGAREAENPPTDRPSSEAGAQASAPAARPAEPALAAGFAPSATAAGAPPTGSEPVPALRLSVPPEAADFGRALALQMQTWVDQGVQEARLHLMPEGLGSVAVRIVLDGSLAQIDFHAAQAATREALEASLPALAAGLQAGGLTLSGGGVFDGREAPPLPEAGAPGRRRALAGTLAAPDAPGPAPLAARAWDGRPGGLDLYA